MISRAPLGPPRLPPLLPLHLLSPAVIIPPPLSCFHSLPFLSLIFILYPLPLFSPSSPFLVFFLFSFLLFSLPPPLFQAFFCHSLPTLSSSSSSRLSFLISSLHFSFHFILFSCPSHPSPLFSHLPPLFIPSFPVFSFVSFFYLSLLSASRRAFHLFSCFSFSSHLLLFLPFFFIFLSSHSSSPSFFLPPFLSASHS